MDSKFLIFKRTSVIRENLRSFVAPGPPHSYILPWHGEWIYFNNFLALISTIKHAMSGIHPESRRRSVSTLLIWFALLCRKNVGAKRSIQSIYGKVGNCWVYLVYIKLFRYWVTYRRHIDDTTWTSSKFLRNRNLFSFHSN